jgi:hypothetical protein
VIHPSLEGYALLKAARPERSAGFANLGKVNEAALAD